MHPKVPMGDGTPYRIKVPNEVEVEVELEIDDDGTSLEIEISWQ